MDSDLLASVQKITGNKDRQKRQLFGALLETFVFNERLKISKNTSTEGVKKNFVIYTGKDLLSFGNNMYAVLRQELFI